MAQNVNVNFKLDQEVKKNMEEACSDMGLSLSAAFTIFAIKVGKERRIPFDITAYPQKESYEQMIERRVADIKAGVNVREHELVEVD